MGELGKKAGELVAAVRDKLTGGDQPSGGPAELRSSGGAELRTGGAEMRSGGNAQLRN